MNRDPSMRYELRMPPVTCTSPPVSRRKAAAQRARIVAAIRQRAPTSQPRATSAAQLAQPSTPRSADAAQRAVTFMQHCIFIATRYQSRAAAHNLYEYAHSAPATICRIDLILASCIQQPEARAGPATLCRIY